MFVDMNADYVSLYILVFFHKNETILEQPYDQKST